MSTNTVSLHRVLRATPEKVFRALTDADAMAKWLPPHGFTGKVRPPELRVAFVLHLVAEHGLLGKGLGATPGDVASAIRKRRKVAA